MARAMHRDDVRRRVVAVLSVVAVVAAAFALWGLVHNEPETVAEDFTELYPAYSLEPIEEVGEVPSDVGRLIGPHFDLNISEVAVVDSITTRGASDQLEREGLPSRFRAAEHHELVVARFGGSDVMRVDDEGDPTYFGDDPEANLAVAVRVGDLRVELPDGPSPQETLVVSVPRGADVQLEVRDEGRTQSISLRTGERQDVVDGFYVRVDQELDYTYSETRRAIWVIGLAVQTFSATLTLDFESAERTPWLTGFGYAGPGRAWLIVRTGQFQSLIHPFIEIDAAAAYVLVQPDGTEIPARPYTIAASDIVQHAIFDVPETFTTGTFSIRPAAGTRWTERGVGWETPPPDASIPLNLTESPIG